MAVEPHIIVTEREHDDVLLRPRSVAVLGATSDPRALASRPLENLRAYGAGVDVIAIGDHDIDDVETVPDVQALDTAGGVDLLLVPSLTRPLEDFLAEAAGVVRAVVVTGAPGGWADIRRRSALEQQISESGLRFVGPNALGVLNVTAGCAPISSFNIPPDLRQGHVTIVSQSGAVATTALLWGDSVGVRFDVIVAGGSELGMTTAELLELVIQRDSTKAVALYFEGLRDPRSVLEAGELAAARNVPIVVLRGGRTQAGQTAAKTHSGAIATHDRRLSSALEARGFIEVEDVRTLVATAAVFADRGIPTGDRVGILTPSGGLNVMLSDMAGRAGLRLASLAPDTARRLQELLPGTNPTNPFESTGRVLTQPKLLQQVLETFYGDAGVDIGVFVTNTMMEDRGATVVDTLAKLPTHVTPAIVAMPGAGRHTTAAQDVARRSGSMVMDDVTAVIEVLTRLTRRSRWHPELPRTVPDELRKMVAAVHTSDDAATLLGKIGIRGPEERLVISRTAAARAVAELGAPVAMKAVAQGLEHKSDAGGVVLDVRTGLEAKRTFETFKRMFGPRLIGARVQQMVTPIAELLVAVLHDADLGPMVTLGLGGVWTEVLDDVQILPAPIAETTALEALTALRGAATLQGGRGRPVADVGAAAAAAAALSLVAAVSDPGFGTLEVNPLAVMPVGDGVMALDVRYVAGHD